MTILDNISVILVGTSHPGNIGSAARALKTMGLSKLCLVAPRTMPDEHSLALAAGAKDIVENIIIYSDLKEAIADCQLVIGASARSRGYDWPLLTPKEASIKAIQNSNVGKVAIIFGRENNGLSNEELQLCNYHLIIDANPEYSSINLAQAVQIICYELRVSFQAFKDNQINEQHSTNLPTSEELEGFFNHLQVTLLDTGFIVKNHPGQIMSKLRRLFNKSKIEKEELNILRGILTSIKKRRE